MIGRSGRCVWFSAIMIGVLICGLSSGAAAGQKKWYMGAAIGGTEIESNIVAWHILTPAQLDQEERDVGFKLFGGYQINDFFGVELFYLNCGEIEVKASTGARISAEGVVWDFTQDNTHLNAELSTMGVAGVISVPLGRFTQNKFLKRIIPYVKGGIHYWDVDKSLDPANSADFYAMQNPSPTLTGPTTHQIDDDNGFDWFYGAGLGVWINDRVTVYFGYEWYNLEEDMVEDSDFVNAGVVVRF